jgi:hypothetical protein
MKKTNTPLSHRTCSFPLLMFAFSLLSFSNATSFAYRGSGEFSNSPGFQESPQILADASALTKDDQTIYLVSQAQVPDFQTLQEQLPTDFPLTLIDLTQKQNMASFWRQVFSETLGWTYEEGAGFFAEHFFPKMALKFCWKQFPQRMAQLAKMFGFAEAKQIVSSLAHAALTVAEIGAVITFFVRTGLYFLPGAIHERNLERRTLENETADNRPLLIYLTDADCAHLKNGLMKLGFIEALAQ